MKLFKLIKLLVVTTSFYSNCMAENIIYLDNLKFESDFKNWMRRGKVVKTEAGEIELDCVRDGHFTIIQQKVKNVKIGDIIEFRAKLKSDFKGGQLMLCEGGYWGGKKKLSQYRKAYYSGRNKGEWQKISTQMQVKSLPLYAGIGLYRAVKQKLLVKAIKIKKLVKPDKLTLREAANLWNTTFSPQSQIFDKKIFKDYADINVIAAGNEFALAAVMLHNPSKKNLYAKINLVPLNKQAESVADKILFREALHIRARMGQLVADPLPLISKDKIVSIPAGETRQVMVEFFTGNLKADKYKYKLQVNTCDKEPESVSIPVNFTIVDFALPETIPLQIATWDCSLKNSKGKLRDELLKTLRTARVNTFHVLTQMKAEFKKSGEMIGKPDFSKLDELLRLYGTKNVQVWLRGGRFLRPNKKGKLKNDLFELYSPQWRRALKDWVKAVRDHMAHKGYRKDQWCFYPYDEYLGESYQKIVEEIRAIDPSLKIFANPCKPKTDNGNDLLEMAKNKKFDILCPVFGKYYPREHYKEIPAKLRKLGVKQTFYYCPVIQKRLSPVNFYREMGWRIFHYNLDGGGYWTALGFGGGRWGGNPWNDFDAKTASPVSIYNYSDEVVPSRRWLAFRAGIEDYCYIYLMQQSSSRKKIDEILGESKKLPKRNYVEIEKLRRKMTNELLGLKNSRKINFSEQTTVPVKSGWSYLSAKDKKEPARLKLMLENYLKSAKTAVSLPEELKNIVKNNAVNVARLLKEQTLKPENMPKDLEKISIKYKDTFNPESIKADNIKTVKLTLYNLALPYSQWVAVQAGTPVAPQNIKVNILNGTKTFRANEANIIQVPPKEPVNIEVSINLKGETTELNIFPLDHLNKNAVRKIKIKK